jgi:YbgC/YbaW family acyl-CoA thioester hydrolase
MIRPPGLIAIIARGSRRSRTLDCPRDIPPCAMTSAAPMFSTAFTIEWGDCDEAGIVFYPNYFYWFDCAFQRPLYGRGLSQRELRRRFGAVTPIVQAHCDFKAPARYDDEREVEVRVQSEREREIPGRLSPSHRRKDNWAWI